MLDAYAQIPFDNPNGGVWKQGFEITYDKQKIQSEKRLEVVVIPHSHCDPGWLKTFEEYYDSQTQQILNGMLQHLDKKPDMKFIYAEMSFFELWWSRLTEAQKEKTRRWVFSELRVSKPESTYPFYIGFFAILRAKLYGLDGIASYNVDFSTHE